MTKLHTGFSFKIKKAGIVGRSRAGVLRTPHGQIKTPAFAPVGTAATVKALTPDDLLRVKAEMILVNSYHLYLRPGDRVIEKMGGVHKFMGWAGPILSDSGGYQVSSLGAFRDKDHLVKIDADGVDFRSHLDGSEHRFTPEKVVDIQRRLGSDIIMAFDEATPDKGKKYAKQAMQRTHSWLESCIDRWKRVEKEKQDSQSPQALFGIIQGGNYKDLRRESASYVVEKNLPGIAIGGASIGKSASETKKNLSWIKDLLPSSKPLYLMGVGVNPLDLLAAVESGADLFDCVAPTRLARMGHLYTGSLEQERKGWKFVSGHPRGRMNIANSKFKLDDNPIMEDCDCYTCKTGFSSSYLNHLFRAKELLYFRLASIHNLRFMIRLVSDMREHILSGGSKD